MFPLVMDVRFRIICKKTTGMRSKVHMQVMGERIRSGADANQV